MIDDYVENLKSIYEQNPDLYGLLYNAPHNKYTKDQRFIKVNDWKSIESYVTSYKNYVISNEMKYQFVQGKQ